MKKQFGFSKQLLPIIIIAGCLVALTCYYYVVFIPQNETKLNKQHFKWIQKVDQNIRDKVTGYDSLLSSLMRVYTQDRGKSFSLDYFKKHNGPEFTISGPDSLSANKPGHRFDHTNAGKPFGSKTDPDYLDSSKSFEFSMTADSTIDELVITLIQRHKDQTYRISVRTKFSDFIKPLLPEEIFDHFVVFYNGRWVYEDFHSGLSYKNDDSLLQGAKGISAATILVQKVAGEDYYMFLQPINLGGKRIIVAGLHLVSKFSVEKKRIDTTTTIFFIATCVLILLFIPWLKILTLGYYDKVHLSDSIWSTIVAKLFVSIIAYLFIEFFNYETADHNVGSKYIAEKISDNITKELDSTHRVLISLDSLLPGDRLLDLTSIMRPNGITLKAPPDSFYEGSSAAKIKQKIVSICPHLKLIDIFWLDSAGNEKANWTANQYNDIHGNYKDREYFKSVQAHYQKDSTKTFTYFGQLVSRTSALFTTVLSTRSHIDSLTVAMEFDLKSTTRPVLPIGYDFAIIDCNGEVRYHSKEKKNLNENLLEEFSEDGAAKLKKAILGGFENEFETDYYERYINVTVRPLPKYDYYIVVMRDMQYVQEVEASVFAFAITMTILFLLLSLLDVFVVAFFSSKRSYIKSLSTSWLWPRKSSVGEYVIGVFAYTFVLALSVGYYLATSSVLLFLCIVLVNPPLLSLLLNLTFLDKYSNLNIWYEKLKRRSTTAIWVYVVVVNVFALGILSPGSFLSDFLLYEALAMSAWMILIIFKSSIVNKFSKCWREDYLNWYTLLVYIRVIVTGGLPVIFCVVSAHNYEKTIATRFAQIDFVNKLRKVLSTTDLIALRNVSDSNNTANSHAIYYDDVFIAEASKDTITQTEDLNDEQQYAVNFLGEFEELIQDKFASNGLYRDTAFGNVFHFNNIFDNLIKNTHSPIYIKSRVDVDPNGTSETGTKKYIYMRSGNPEFFINLPPYPVAWFLLALTLFLSYLLLRVVIRKFFSRRLVLFESGASNDIRKHQAIEPVNDSQQDGSTEFHPAILLLGPSYDDQCKLFLSSIKSTSETRMIDEILKDYEALKKIDKNWYIVFRNLENVLLNSTLRLKKIKKLQCLIRDGKKIVIVSSKHPLQIIDETKSVNYKNKITLNQEEEAILADLLTHVLIIEAPYFTSTDYKSPDELTDFNQVLVDLVKNETRYSEFLNNLEKGLLSMYGSCQNDGECERLVKSDAVVLKIQIEAFNFYNAVWFSLSEREKFILIDLAEDGLVNTADIYNTTKLINKRVIVVEDGGLHIFSRSFRNFILTSLSIEEGEKIRKIYKEKNNWRKLRTPLLFATITILVFLSISQNDVYTRIIGIFGGLAAILPTLAKILAFWGTNSNKREA